MKATLFFVLILILVSAYCSPTTFAQYEPYTQMGLPEGAKARFGQGPTFFGFSAPSPTAVDPWIAVGGYAGVWVYDAETLQLRGLLREHLGGLYSLRSSPDGSTLGVGFYDGTVELWDVPTGTRLKTLTGHSERVSSLHFSSDGSTLATASFWGNSVHLWDVATGALDSTFDGGFTADGNSNNVHSISFSRDDSLLAVAFYDGVRLWNVATGSLHNAFIGPTVVIHHADFRLRFSPDGTFLVAGVGSNTLRLWDVATGTLRHAFKGGTYEFSPDGGTLATGSRDGTVRLWDVATGTLRHAFKGGTFKVIDMGFSPDGSILATMNERDEEVRLWDVDAGELYNTLRGHTLVNFGHDGSTLTTQSADGIVRLWDITTGEVRNTLEWQSFGRIASVRFSPDGSTLAGGSGHGQVYLWDVATGRVRKVLTKEEDPDGPINSMSFSPDGSTLATTNSWPNGVCLWDVAAGTPGNILGHPFSVNTMSFSPDGRTLATGMEPSYIVEMPTFDAPDGFDDSDDLIEPLIPEFKIPTLQILDAITGFQKVSFAGYTDPVYSVSFNPEGSLLAMGGWGLHLWDVSTGKMLDDHFDVYHSVRFSPDGNTLATGSGDGTVCLWDVFTDKLRMRGTLEGHTSYVFDVDFSPDGNTLATGSWDGTIRLWDASTGTLRKVFTAAPWGVRSISFSPDGSLLAANNEFDWTVLLWEVGPAGEPPRPAADVNGDGVVNIYDLALVAARFGQTGENTADVNGDGVVNILDLLRVASAFGETAAAPEALRIANVGTLFARSSVQQWLAEAQQMEFTDAVSLRGIAVLEHLLSALTPKKTALLPNYPNPFNPETWIPYQLVHAADVTLSIHAMDGTEVRTLVVGYRPAGIYQDQSRAIYWNGKNALGEQVASGVYFYTLTAGDFTATRKMLIRK